MKTVNVAAGILVEGARALATQRGYGDFKGLWEFPGGKIKEGESPESALRRELWEELRIEAEVGQMLKVIDYDYGTFHLHMSCFICTISQGTMQLTEHEDAQWLAAQELTRVTWLPADAVLIPEVAEFLSKRSLQTRS